MYNVVTMWLFNCEIQVYPTIDWKYGPELIRNTLSKCEAIASSENVSLPVWPLVIYYVHILMFMVEPREYNGDGLLAS